MTLAGKGHDKSVRVVWIDRIAETTARCRASAYQTMWLQYDGSSRKQLWTVQSLSRRSPEIQGIGFYGSCISSSTTGLMTPLDTHLRTRTRFISTIWLAELASQAFFTAHWHWGLYKQAIVTAIFARLQQEFVCFQIILVSLFCSCCTSHAVFPEQDAVWTSSSRTWKAMQVWYKNTAWTRAPGPKLLGGRGRLQAEREWSRMLRSRGTGGGGMQTKRSWCDW